jgi:hypothetical protein
MGMALLQNKRGIVEIGVEIGEALWKHEYPCDEAVLK